MKYFKVDDTLIKVCDKLMRFSSFINLTGPLNGVSNIQVQHENTLLGLGFKQLKGSLGRCKDGCGIRDCSLKIDYKGCKA